MNAGVMHKSHPVQVTRHMYIGEKSVDPSRFDFQDCNCLPGMRGFDHVKTIIQQCLGQHHADKWLIFNHDYDDSIGCRFLGHTIGIIPSTDRSILP